MISFIDNAYNLTLFNLLNQRVNIIYFREDVK